MQRALLIVLFSVLPGACQTITCNESNTIYGSYQTNVDNGFCKNATFNGNVSATCSAPAACMLATFSGSASANCSGSQGCRDTTFTGSASAICSGQWACWDATFNDTVRVSCTDEDACLDAAFNGNAIATCSGDRSGCSSSTYNDNACCTGTRENSFPFRSACPTDSFGKPSSPCGCVDFVFASHCDNSTAPAITSRMPNAIGNLTVCKWVTQPPPLRGYCRGEEDDTSSAPDESSSAAPGNSTDSSSAAPGNSTDSSAAPDESSSAAPGSSTDSSSAAAGDDLKVEIVSSIGFAEPLNDTMQGTVTDAFCADVKSTLVDLGVKTVVPTCTIAVTPARRRLLAATSYDLKAVATVPAAETTAVNAGLALAITDLDAKLLANPTMAAANGGNAPTVSTKEIGSTAAPSNEFSGAGRACMVPSAIVFVLASSLFN